MGQVVEFPMEDWTHGDPLLQEIDTLRRDAHAMAREIVRLRAIERASNKLMQHHSAGEVRPVSPLACMAVAELEGALGGMRQWSLL